MNPLSMRTRVALADRDQPASHPRSVVTWRSAGCTPRCRLLRVFPHSDYWEVVGDDFRVHPEQWIRMLNDRNGTDHTLFEYNEGSAPIPVPKDGPRRVRGLKVTLPRDFSAWPPAGSILVGCDHGNVRADTEWLKADCMAAARTRSPQRRTVTYPPVLP